jgi:hypothetical protein
MKNIIAIIAIVITGIGFANAQSVERKMNFQPGDVVCSSNGKLVGGELFSSKEVAASNFIGVFTGPPTKADARRDEVFVSKGLLDVNTSASNIQKGDYVTTGANGKAIKATETGYVIGIATEAAHEGKVKVALSYQYVVIR